MRRILTAEDWKNPAFSEGYSRGLEEGRQYGVGGIIVVTLIGAAEVHSLLVSGAFIAIGVAIVYSVSKSGGRYISLDEEDGG